MFSAGNDFLCWLEELAKAGWHSEPVIRCHINLFEPQFCYGYLQLCDA